MRLSETYFLFNRSKYTDNCNDNAKERKMDGANDGLGWEIAFRETSKSTHLIYNLLNYYSNPKNRREGVRKNQLAKGS